MINYILFHKNNLFSKKNFFFKSLHKQPQILLGNFLINFL